MTRNAVKSVAMILAASVSVLMVSCGESDKTPFANQEQQGRSLLAQSAHLGDLVAWDRIAVFIVISEEKHVSPVFDSRTSSLIVSLLPDSARERLAAAGLVFIEDEEIASAIGSIAAVESSRASGVWVGLEATWGCIKCCYATPACDGCNPCPACCEDKDVYVEVPFKG